MAIQPSLEQRVRNSLFCLAGITAAVGLNGCGTKTEGPIAPLDGTPSQAASTNNTRSVGGQTITFNQGSRAFGLGRRVDVTVKTGDAVVRYLDNNGDGYVDTVSVQSAADGPTSTYSRGNTYLNDVITEAQQGYHDAVNSSQSIAIGQTSGIPRSRTFATRKGRTGTRDRRDANSTSRRPRRSINSHRQQSILLITSDTRASGADGCPVPRFVSDCSWPATA